MAILTGGSITSIKQVSSFPANAKEGEIVYHAGIKALFVNINDSGDTTDISAWEIASSKTVINEIPSSVTQNCDSISISLYRTVKWVVSITNNVDGKYLSFEVLAVHDNTDVIFNEYSIIGDNINYVIDVFIDSGNLTLSLTNNELNNINVSILRFSLI